MLLTPYFRLVRVPDFRRIILRALFFTIQPIDDGIECVDTFYVNHIVGLALAGCLRAVVALIFLIAEVSDPHKLLYCQIVKCSLIFKAFAQGFNGTELK